MPPTLTKCIRCQNEFIATHGNREYCPEAECQKANKAANQKKYYEIYKDMVSGYVGNYRLFEEVLANVESKTIAVQDLQIQGFDQNAYYGSFKGDTQEWYVVKDYAFHIFYQPTDNKVYITIKKVSS